MIYRSLFKNTAFEHTTSDKVAVNEEVTVHIPEIDSEGKVTWKNVTPFEVVLWHEAIGHGYLDYSHPKEPWNSKRGWYNGNPMKDPTIAVENEARECLRLQGTAISDRVPKYWGWRYDKYN